MKKLLIGFLLICGCNVSSTSRLDSMVISINKIVNTSIKICADRNSYLTSFKLKLSPAIYWHITCSDGSKETIDDSKGK